MFFLPFLCFLSRKIHDMILPLFVAEKPSLRASSSDAPRCVSQFSTLCRLFLHVNFPLSTSHFQLHPLFCMTAYHAVLTLS